MMGGLSDDARDDLTCEVLFDQILLGDRVNLRIVCLFVDPLCINAPLHFWLLSALKKSS